MVGRQKHKFFSMIKTRVLNKIKGWPSQLFSRGGKEILLKAIVQAIPTYAMSVFRLPKGLCEDLQRQITNYWWGSSNRSRGIHLDLLAKVLKARYFRHSDFLHCQLASKPSYVWKSIRWGREVIKAGSRWKIGDGKSIRIDTDNWLPRPITFKPLTTMLPRNSVAELMNPDQSWNEPRIRSLFLPIDVEVILRIPLPHVPQSDQLVLAL